MKLNSIINPIFYWNISMKKQHFGFLLMVIAAVGLAFATILMKVILEVTRMSPAHVAIWRFSIAAPLMWMIVCLRQKSSSLIPQHPFWLMGLGVVYSLASFSALFALSRLPSSLYVIIVYVYPSFVVLFSLVTGRSVPRLYWLGLPLTFLGLILTTYQFGGILMVDWIGLLITLVNALAMAAYLILSEKVFLTITDRLLGTNWMLTGAMLVGLLVIPLMKISTPDTSNGWVLLLSFGIFGTFMPIWAMNIGLQLIGAARGSIIITLQPVLAVLFSTIFLGDSLTLQQWIGGLLVISAIVLLQLSSDRKEKLKTT